MLSVRRVQRRRQLRHGQSLGNGTIALQLLDGGANPFASMVPGAYGLRMQFQNELGNWCTQVGASSTFQPIPTGDGYFALYAPGLKRYVTVSATPEPDLVKCYPLLGGLPTSAWPPALPQRA